MAGSSSAVSTAASAGRRALRGMYSLLRRYKRQPLQLQAPAAQAWRWRYCTSSSLQAYLQPPGVGVYIYVLLLQTERETAPSQRACIDAAVLHHMLAESLPRLFQAAVVRYARRISRYCRCFSQQVPPPQTVMFSQSPITPSFQVSCRMVSI